MEPLWIVLVLLTLVRQNHCYIHQWFVDVPWEVEVFVEETRPRELLTLECEPNPDVDWGYMPDTKVEISETYPEDMCQHCFEVYRNDTSSHYKLYYFPSHEIMTIHDLPPYPGFNLLLSCTIYPFPADKYLQIIVKTNEHPSFSSLTANVTGIDASATVKDTDLYTVTDASDPDHHQLFYSLTVRPETSASKYSIGLTDGKIRAAVDLSTECGQTVQLLVTVRDFIPAHAGPKVITLLFSDCNQEIESTTEPISTTPQTIIQPTTTPSYPYTPTQTAIPTSTAKSQFPGSSSQGNEASNVAWICVLSVTGCVAIVTTAFLVYRLCLSDRNCGSFAVKNKINP